MPEPGSLAIICIWIDSSGCSVMMSRFGVEAAACSAKIENGGSENSMMISEWRVCIRLPVRRKKGTPAQRALLTWARIATKVSVRLFAGTSASCR